MAINDFDEQHQSYGQMLQCTELAYFIESGQLNTIQDILNFLKCRGDALNNELLESGFFKGTRSLSSEEYDLWVAQFEAKEPGTVFN